MASAATNVDASNLFLKDYTFAEKLGSGSYGTVFKAHGKAGCRNAVAVKSINKTDLSKSEVDNIITEISLLKKLRHEFVVEMKDFSWDHGHIYIIMEYCGGGDLSRFIKTKRCLPETVCRRFLRQLASALKYLRSNNVSHMDLKPQNILLTNVIFGHASCRYLQPPVLKLCDFGFAQYLSCNQTKTSLRGSPLYMAPEMVLKRQYDAKVDLWSVGVILFECLFGRAPFKSSSVDELLAKIKEEAPVSIPHAVPNLSEECSDLLARCLQRDPAKRIDFVDFFNHPFIDLEHMPSVDSEKKAEALIAKAASLEASGSRSPETLRKALDAYRAALEYLVPLVHADQASGDMKAGLRTRVERQVRKAEELKVRIVSLEGGDLRTAVLQRPEPLTKVTKVRLEGTPTLPGTNPKVEELLRLSSVTPQLRTGVEILRDAELYELEGQYSVALSNYEKGLGIVIQLMKQEPKGPRKTLLLSETNRWMRRAEMVKELLAVQNKVLVDWLKTRENSSPTDIDKQCIVQ